MVFALPGATVVKVIRTRYNYTARWISRCPLPTLGGYGETREIALKHYKILQSYRVELVIDSAIGTLFFNSDYPRDSGEFIFDVEEDFLKPLRHQAIYETPFSIWNNATYEQLFWCLSCLMMGLERLMLGIEIFRYVDPLNPAEPQVRERWMGWEFGGGVPTWE
jgi:hypothetical protein